MVSSMSKYMSLKKTVPLWTISLMAISLPCMTSSGVSLSSNGQM